MVARWTTSRIGLSALGAAALIAVVASWLVFLSKPRASSPSIAPPIPPSSAPASRELADIASPETRESKPAVESFVASTRAPVDTLPVAEDDISPRVFLRGRVESDRTDLELARVEVRARSPDDRYIGTGDGPPRGAEMQDAQLPLTCAVAHDGQFELEVTALALRTGTLVVSASHPSLLAVTESVSTRPVASAKPGARVELSVELSMAQGGCVVRGRVAKPSEPAPTAYVAIFPLTGANRLPAPNPAMQIETSDGKFELGVRSGDEYALVAFAELWRPTTVQIARTSDGDVIDVGVLQLERGASISGRVLLGSWSPSGPGASVFCEVEHADAIVSADRFNFAWIAGAFEWTRRNTQANDFDLYELQALGRCAYALKLASRVPGTFIHDVEPISVLAPAQGVDLAPRACELKLEIVYRGEPAKNAGFLFRQRRDGGLQFSGYSSDASGRATLWLAPDTAGEIVVRDARAAERTYPIYGCAAGETVALRIDL
jgi:hypothetical protein